MLCARVIARENEVLNQSARVIFDNHQCDFTKYYLLSKVVRSNFCQRLCYKNLFGKKEPIKNQMSLTCE